MEPPDGTGSPDGTEPPDGTWSPDVSGSPYLAELVHRMKRARPTLIVEARLRGRATLLWEEPGIDHPLVLYVRERDLADAVTAIGEDCRDALWPDSTIEAAGFNLLLVHLDEVLATRDTSDPLRITDQGLEWPERLRPDEEP